jgi:arginase
MAYLCEKYGQIRDKSIFIGGDHLSSFSTVLSSLMRYGNDFKLVWIDAHADIHSFDSSPSWNLHGMVVRLLMTHSVPDVPRLLPSQICYIGLRSVEQAEWDFIHENNIMYVTSETLHSYNRNNALLSIRSFILDQHVHISLDVDAFDPSIISNTGTPEENGLSIVDFVSILNIIKSSGTHYATDIMEINPQLGDNDASVVTLKKVCSLLVD